MTRALVLGATGFIGMATVDALLARGIEVRALRRPRSMTILLRRRPVELVVGELADLPSIERALSGCDLVIHAASHYPRYSLEAAASTEQALAETRCFLDALRGSHVDRAVVVGTIATLGEAPASRPASEEDSLHQAPLDSPYRALKWHVQRELSEAHRDGSPVVSLLPGACLGPGDLRVGTSALLMGLARGALPFWLEGWVNIIDVRDVAECLVTAALSRGPLSREIALPGHSNRTSALFPLVVQRYGGALPPVFLDAETARERADADERLAAPRRARVPFPRELVDLIASGQRVSGARAERELGLSPRPLITTLDDAYESLARRGLVPRRERRMEEQIDGL